MKRFMVSGCMVILTLVLVSMPVYAYFRHSLVMVNNTFATGNIALRFFYDCQSPSGQTNIWEDSYGPSNDFAIVECQPDGDGSDEQNQDDSNSVFALTYAPEHGATYNVGQAGDIFNLEGDWSPENGWWGGLSSALDHTLIYPGWGSNIAHASRDLVSVGNSGNLPQDLYLTFLFEAFDEHEQFEGLTVEPQDGSFSSRNGGDQVDPYVDQEWSQLKQYSTDLANKINLDVYRIDNLGQRIEGTTQGGTLRTFQNYPHFLGTLQPNEVARIKLEWAWKPGEEPEEITNYEDQFFDYSLRFDAVQEGGTPPAES